MVRVNRQNGDGGGSWAGERCLRAPFFLLSCLMHVQSLAICDFEVAAIHVTTKAAAANKLLSLSTSRI